MNNLYVSARELQEVLHISYKSALEIIVDVREKMKEKGFFIPNTRTKLALTWMVKEKIGLKEW